MPSAKSGTACTLIPPASPQAALEADEADPGVVDQAIAAQQQAGPGKYGAQPVKPFKPGGDSGGSRGGGGGDGGPADPADQTGWVEVVLVDDAGQPVAGEAYAVTLPDGSVASGTLDEKGLARVQGFQPGDCQITFPNLDAKAWNPA